MKKRGKYLIIMVLVFSIVLVIFLFNYDKIRFSPEEPVSPSIGSSKIRAVYSGELSSENIRLSQSKGINTFLVKLGEGTHTFKAHYTLDDLSDILKYHARWAKDKDFIFIPIFNFVHFINDPDDVDGNGRYSSVITTNNVVYSDGSVGKHVTPFDDKYWKHLTTLAVSLAELDNDPDHRVDGLMIDFELYKAELYGEPRKFNGLWGFERTTFDKYILNRGISPPTLLIPPEGKADTYYWLEEEGKLDDYYLFLRQEIMRLAEDMKAKVSASNPDFLLGLYPTGSKAIDYSNPGNGKWYLSQILAGWSDINNPTILFSDTTYNDPDSLPKSKLINGEVFENGVSKNYYRFDQLFRDSMWDEPSEISEAPYAYYLSGLDSIKYSDNILGESLYYFMEYSNGYWIYKGSEYHGFENFDEIKDASLRSGWKDCIPTNGGVETCDGVDNDCDYDVDENNADCSGATPDCINGECSDELVFYEADKFLVTVFYEGWGEVDVASFENNGDIYLAGRCFHRSNCISSKNLFSIKDLSGKVVASIDEDGHLCISSSNCDDYSETCNPSEKAFVIKNPSSGTIVSYIDFNGDLCLTGKLYENEL